LVELSPLSISIIVDLIAPHVRAVAPERSPERKWPRRAENATEPALHPQKGGTQKGIKSARAAPVERGRGRQGAIPHGRTSGIARIIAAVSGSRILIDESRAS